MHKVILAFALVSLVAVAVPAQAQDETPVGVWQNEFALGLNVLQSSYSQNWNGGDKGSVVWNGYLRRPHGEAVQRVGPTGATR